MIAEPNKYRDLLHLFLELRGQGTSLSANDLRIMDRWAKHQHDSDWLCEVMMDVAAELKVAQKPFPPTLLLVDKRVSKILKRRSES